MLKKKNLGLVGELPAYAFNFETFTDQNKVLIKFYIDSIDIC